MLNKNRARHAVRAAVLSALAIFAAPMSSAHAEKIQLDVAAGEAPDALKEFIRQTGLQLIFDFDSIAAFKTHAVSGQFDAAEALTRMLSNTGLAFEFVNERTVTVTRKEAITQRPKVIPTKVSYERDASATSEVERIRLAQAVEAATSSHETTALESSSKEDLSERRIQLEEVVVTGSHIRGVQDLSSPVIRFDRDDLEASGHTTLSQFIRGLPQNVSAVADTTFGAVNGGLNEVTYGGSGANLRGLGSDSTLVLLDGRRMAAAGQGSFVDISLIPMSAVERIDILGDGASAIYGSDAVAGVMNIVLRDDFDGAETRLRYGTVTEGSHNEFQVGQMLGTSWSTGKALLSYEYYRRTTLDGADRSFIELNEQLPVYEAIPEQKRNGALAVISQRISEGVELTTDVFVGHRESSYQYALVGGLRSTDDEVLQYGGSLALSIDLARDWQVRVSGLTDQNHSDQITNFVQSGALYNSTSNESSVWSADLAADGPIGRISGGEMRLAVGSQFRTEQFREKRTSIAADLEREVSAVYAEMRVPLVSANNRHMGAEHLEVTLAGRLEDYDDFGSTLNPKIGLAWAPISGLNVRGTWGTSFRAPQLSHMNPANRSAIVAQGFFRDVSGLTTAALLSGTSEGLGPEESRNRTIGFDFTPSHMSDLNLSVTYFDVDYKQRIREPFPADYDPFGVLMDSNYAVTVTRDMDPAQLAALLSQYKVTCFTSSGNIVFPCTSPPVAEITAVVDSRITNLSSIRVSGLDFSFGYGFTSPFGDWTVSLLGQKQLKNREQLVTGMPEVSQMNTVWRPTDLRLRNNVGFTRGDFNATVVINFTDDYRDNRAPSLAGPGQRSRVSSWSTVDLSLRYDLGGSFASGGLGEVTLGLSAVNLFDRDPPFIASYNGLFFDGVNASPLGRFVGAQITARW